jgi:hypothetical protein
MSKKSNFEVEAMGAGASLLATFWSLFTREVSELGGTVEDLRRLTKPEGAPLIADFAKRLVETGKTKAVFPKFIDCDAYPFVPEGWKVEEHRKGGKFATADLKMTKLFLSDGQKGGEYMVGNELRKELKSKPVLNANALDFFLKHPEFIPEEWKSMAIFFWGTIYRHSNSRLYVRGLNWCGDAWDWCNHWVDDGWNFRFPAALAAS